MEQQANNQGQLTVLLATQDGSLKDRVLAILEEYHCPVAIVDNCIDALERLLDYDFDFVIFDPELKDLTGYDTVQLIKRIRPETPLVVFADDSSFETGVKIAKAGVYFRMDKSINANITKQLIQSLEQRRRKQ